jgi:glycosyltransferase involved in cell wall biosynthesis
MVSIDCTTYNHAPYIRQCLDGFLMQKINFPIEVLVHDDASTDGTADIIREYEQKYPDIIKPIYQSENQYSNGINNSLTYNFPRVRGKYIAFCEGDDYWVDPYKLQKQVDFLEKNSEYGMCYTKVKTYIQRRNKYLKKTFGGNSVAFSELIYDNTIPTLTVCLKKKLLRQYYKEIKPESKEWLMGDYPL